MTETPDPAAAATSAVRAMIEQWVSLSKAVAEHTLGPVGGVPPTVADTVARVLGAINLPTRDEVRAVGEAVATLDARLARIEAALAHLPLAPDPATHRRVEAAQPKGE